MKNEDRKRTQRKRAGRPDTETRLQEALLHQKQGALDTAEALYRSVLRDVPDHPDALHLLGIVALQKGDGDGAIASIKRAVELRPDNVEFRLNLGAACEACGDLTGAILSLEQSLRLDPQLTPAWIKLASLLQQIRHLEPAAECLQQALRLEPDNVACWINLGALHHQQADFDAASSCYMEALILDPTNHEARINRAAVLRAQGQADHAVSDLLAVQRDGGDSPELHYNLANALCDCGRFETARDHYQQVLDKRPDSAKVIYNLATITRFRVDDRTRVQAWQALASRPDLCEADRTWLHFALGKAWNDLQEFDAAFTNYARGNALVETDFDAVAHRALIDGTVATFSPAFWAERADWGFRSERPVFIVGMPRSGTTLVEQILATHSQVHTAGERIDVDRLIRDCCERHQVPSYDLSAATRIPSAEAWTMARQYVHQIFPESGESLVVDKMPTNFLWLGWIALWFPQAHVIHCRRDPRDVCLSCYFQHFTHQLPFAYDLDHLVTYYGEYDRLMRHWHETLPIPILDVPYEDLVAEPERFAREIVEFCNLEWEPACLDFHKTDRAVSTASHWQVRQPIYQSSSGRWRNYRKHIGVLLEAFGSDDG